jgi:hypothetical protein
VLEALDGILEKVADSETKNKDRVREAALSMAAD